MFKANGEYKSLKSNIIEGFSNESYDINDKLNNLNNKLSKLESKTIHENYRPFRKLDTCKDKKDEDTKHVSNLNILLSSIDSKLDKIYLFSNIQNIKNKLNFYENNLVSFNKPLRIIGNFKNTNDFISLDTKFLPFDNINESFNDEMINKLSNNNENLIFEYEFLNIKDRIQFILNNFIKIKDYIYLNFESKLIKIYVKNIDNTIFSEENKKLSNIDDASLLESKDLTPSNEFTQSIDFTPSPSPEIAEVPSIEKIPNNIYNTLNIKNITNYDDLLKLIEIYNKKINIIDKNYIKYYNEVELFSTELSGNSIIATISPNN